MTPAPLPADSTAMTQWTWADIEPHYRELESRTLTEGAVESFLADWNAIHVRVHELHQRLYVATTQDIADKEAAERFERFLREVYPAWEDAEQRVRENLLASGLQPQGFRVQLRNMRAESDLFREENIPLLTREQELEERYNSVIGGQSVQWKGEEVPVVQLAPVLQSTDRDERERAWRLIWERRLGDREGVRALWGDFLQLRIHLATNAGFDHYRSFRWRQLLRFDYSPQDAARFHSAVEEVVVPALARMYEKRRRRLGVNTLRPWDLDVDTLDRPPLRPFADSAELENTAASIFHRVDPQLGEYFNTMQAEGLLDLENRPNKAPGGYCTTFAAVRPFIFMNAVGLHLDVQTLLHESGHAFHTFERAQLPYFQQRQVPIEFAEVASMAMELLAAPYLSRDEGGFYQDADAARARVEHLEHCIYLWAHLTSIDLFQHWIYENPQQAADPEQCDRRWMTLRRRLLPVVDWSGLEEYFAISWHPILHIHTIPFYIIEYELAQLGAVQIWANALRDQSAAVGTYRHALSLGATAPLPELYAAAGARFAMDAGTLRRAIALVEATIAERESGGQ